MKLGTLRHNGPDKLVARLDEARALDLFQASGGAPDVADMHSMIAGGQGALDHARALIDAPLAGAVIEIAQAAFRMPLHPVQCRDCLVFEEHLLNSFAQAEAMTGRTFAVPEVWYEQPIFYKGNRMSFIGHGQDVRWPHYRDHLDLELAIVLGKGGTDIQADRAAEHVWGYTILNDVSARDAQMREMAGQLGPAEGKDFDTGNILGPWVVTADEIARPAALNMEVHVTGDRWGGGNSRDMHDDFGAILAHVSAAETLYPDEVIGSGTVGTGCGLETGRRLSDGGETALTIEGIGTLRNTVRWAIP
ncbi:MAG: fumarylacetoacetate hydrolase family protein [Pseudomonadota bacterium]